MESSANSVIICLKLYFAVTRQERLNGSVRRVVARKQTINMRIDTSEKQKLYLSSNRSLNVLNCIKASYYNLFEESIDKPFSDLH